MVYPLFDSGFTLWAADVDSQLMDRHGLSSRGLGLDSRLLLQCYYSGGSVAAAVSMIAARHALAR